MPVEDHGRLDVINRLVDYVTKKLPANEAPLVKNFVRQYFLSVSPEDLSTRSIDDLYGAVLSHWHYIAQRQPGEIKVRVINPQLEKDGWQSNHTVIEIAFDDMPFLVDSVSMILNQLNMNIHIIIHMGSIKIRRDKEGNAVEVLDQQSTSADSHSEAVIYIEIDRQSDERVRENIVKSITKVINDVKIAVHDWPNMRGKAIDILDHFKKEPPAVDEEELAEGIAFLNWLIEDHFTFLGYEEYTIINDKGKPVRERIKDSELGLFKTHMDSEGACKVELLPIAAQELILSKQLIMAGKTDIFSTVHRPVYMDFVSVKTFDKQGSVTGERRFIGLYTAVAYNNSPKQIPLLRRKVNHVLANAGFIKGSHDDRALLNILETLPRDDLIQANEKELLELATNILHLQERQKIRLFIRKETFDHFVSCLVYVPREKFTSALVEKMQEILMQGLDGLEAEYTTRFSESSLARIHFVIRIDPHKALTYDVRALEEKLAEAGRSWQDDLKAALVEHTGEERGAELLKRYQNAFPASYQESFSAKMAVVDIEYFETLTKEKPLAMSLYHPIEDMEDIIRFKLFRIGATIPLSDVVPILENMGLRIISERPYEITPKNGSDTIWINDYRMLHKKGEIFNTETIKDIFQEAFSHVWSGLSENDGFNRLVLGAKLSWREIMVLRAYAKYLWQAGFAFSQDSLEDTLSGNAEISALLIELFKMRFDPNNTKTEDEQNLQKQRIEKALESVSNLNEDRILRRFMDTMMATVRTNYYVKDSSNQPKCYFSFKLDSMKVPELPLPVPLYEIFVYSPRIEGIHLRMAKVARGGIRWSDRRDDFRTEILSLMKTQQVKNAVIVPMGAKGGFVVKKLPVDATREAIMEEVVYCYETLIRGLLDLTDNYKGNDILSPQNVIRYDDNDPYLVVAADKGTATFSDIANSISKEYNFWLGDAFASGGSAGYDHKKMGITARGAWESVKEHFRELNIDPQKDDFTVIGIGDMAGDVFGNGLLLSKHIKLIAAFNHMHIFLDPDPNSEKSFEERQRLFTLPRSTWADYDPKLISTGGGVYLRSLKTITLSKEIQKALDFYQDTVAPNELIRTILRAPVDLFWNGGIGTYVKAARETNAMVNDRSNDALRINGADLRCRSVGEGGNLGFTQLGRIEYAKLGGRLNTDAIDNSGGVNCSDNEVNIKILLNKVVDAGDLTEKQRNEILSELQDEVTELVLNNNRRQTKAISISQSQAVENLEMHSRLMIEMERTSQLDRVLECLPDSEEIANRKVNKQGLTRPEIAVLMAYSKTMLKEALLASDLPEETYFQIELEQAFPKPLQDRFKSFMSQHRLKREIIATQLSNAVINEMGINFISRLQDETGKEPADIIRTFTISNEIFKADELRSLIYAQNGSVDPTVQLKMIHEVNRLVRRGARWFLRNRRNTIDIPESINIFQAPIQRISDSLERFVSGFEGEIKMMSESLMEANVPKVLAFRVAGLSAMFSALDIVEAANLNKLPVEEVSDIYFAVGNQLQLDWFRELIKKRSVGSHWEALARATFRDDLDREQRNLAISILHQNGHTKTEPNTLIDKWLTKHKDLASRWDYFLKELKNAPEADFTMFAVALRELLDMALVSNHKVQKDKSKKG